MRRFLLLFAAGLGLWHAAQAQTNLYFPPTTGTAWVTATPASQGWCQPQLDSVLAYAGRKHSKSLLILKDGKLVVEKYYGTFTADSLWYWASAGKSLTATLVGLAQQDGLLSINDSTSKYLGRWTAATRPQQKQVLLRHQLTMTTGLDDTPPAPCDNESTTPACLRYLTTPATRWAYHTGAYRTLQGVLVAASGAPNITQYTAQRLGTRIGMAGLWYQDVFFSRARDMARFGLFIQAKGTWNSTPVLTDTAYFRRMTHPSQMLNRSYGYLWWLNGQPSYMLPTVQLTFPGPLIPSAPADLLAALGKNDQKIYVVPSLGLVVVRQGQAAGDPKLAASSFDTELWARIMAMLCSTATATTPLHKAGYDAFPNPSTDRLTLRQPTATATTVRLLDALGRVALAHPAAPETQVSTVGLAPGLYLAQWLDANGQVLAARRLAQQ
jgi:CubicO group peptidase (beta-lactamase class C family)